MPGTKFGASAGGGHYYFYSNENKDLYYPISFGQLSVSIGVNALPTPITASLNLASFPSYGSLFEAWSPVSTPNDLNGLYFFLSGSAAIFGNVNTSMIFFLPPGTRTAKNFRELAKDIEWLMATAVFNAGASKAIMALSGHGVETTVGFGAGAGYGYAYVGSPFKLK